MNLDEQRNMMEHAMTERMLNHAFVVLRQWANTLNFGPYIDRIHSLENNYRQLFDYYLIGNDPERDIIHDQLTTEVYRLADEMYADMLLRNGQRPDMHGFEPTNISSVINYFSTCAHLQEEDLDWLVEVATDPERAAVGLAATAALSANLRDIFDENALLALIEIIGSDNTFVADQALASAILLLAYWDVRIDFFKNIQERFMENADEQRAFHIMCALIRSVNKSIKQMIDEEHITPDDLPDEIWNLVGDQNKESSVEDAMRKIENLMPKTEENFVRAIVELLPETWIFDYIVGEDEDRNDRIERIYLEIGSMDLMWDRLDDAEEWLVDRLRSGKATPKDYINYGHCCFLKGDKMMAYENYLEAKRLCNGVRAFFDLFRPDRKMLVEKGIPLEQVYLMEDHLLSKNE